MMNSGRCRLFFFFMMFLMCNVIFADSVRYSCASCGEMMDRWRTRPRLTDGWWYHDGYLKLCAICVKRPACSSCNNAADYDHGDGRWFCRACRAQKVFDQKTAQKIFDETRQYLKKQFGISTDHKIYFSLENKDFMDQIKNSYSKHGAFGYWSPLQIKLTDRNGIEYKSPKVFRIRVISGLSPEYLASVIAHELTHDWSWEPLGKLHKFEQIVEGLARYVEWLYLKSKGEHKMAMWHVENIPEKVYGTGFRRIRELLKDSTNAAEWLPLLKKLEHNRDELTICAEKRVILGWSGNLRERRGPGAYCHQPHSVISPQELLENVKSARKDFIPP